MKKNILILGSLLFYSGALGSEVLFLRPFLNVDFSEIFPTLYFHFLSSVLFALSGCFWFKAQKNVFHEHFFYVALLSSFCLSLFIVIGAPLFLILIFIFSHSEKRLFEEPEELEGDMGLFLEILSPEKMSEDMRETVHGHLEIEPYVDILKGADDELKKGALEQLARVKTKDAIRLIQMALQDANLEIRYYASLKLKKIEDEFSEQILIAKEKLKKEKTPETHTLLGNMYAQFCRMNLLDPVTRDYYTKLALNEYVLSLQLNPHQPLVLKNMAENYFEIHRPDQALKIIDRALALDSKSAEMLLMRCEARLQLEQWNEISKDCCALQLLKKEEIDYEFHFKGLLEYWGTLS